MPIEEFNNLFEKTFFFGTISPKDIFLNESLLESVLDIKNLIVKLAGYYSGNLGYLDSLSFLFFKRLYNQFHRNSNSNFFPLLTNLVKKIYSNFGFQKTDEQCNNFIKKKISQYFNLHLQVNNEDHLQVNNEDNNSNEREMEETVDPDKIKKTK